MAAQERAKQAQMKQAQHTPSSMQAETQKMMEALNGLTDKKITTSSFHSCTPSSTSHTKVKV